MLVRVHDAAELVQKVAERLVRRELIDRGKTVTKPLKLRQLGLAFSEKQIPQFVEKLESRDKQKEALERGTLRVKQAL
jgi:hypothetical protein